MDSCENSVRIDYVSLSSWVQRIEYLRKRLLSIVNENSVVLDAGCGKRNVLISANMVKKLVGCDIDKEFVDSNRHINEGVVADLETVTFPENTFDLIMSFEVIEHLRRPKLFLTRTSRSLKKGGYIFLVTPNKTSLFGFLARWLPNKAKRYITRFLFGKATENEVHYYRLNTTLLLAEGLLSNGFSDIRITMLNDLFSNPLYRITLFPYYELCKLKFFRNFSNAILCIARKK